MKGAMTACSRVEESRVHEAGWCCCSCGAYNMAMRSICRSCGHTFCAVGGPGDPPPNQSPEPGPPPRAA